MRPIQILAGAHVISLSIFRQLPLRYIFVNEHVLLISYILLILNISTSLQEVDMAYQVYFVSALMGHSTAT